MAEFPLAMRFLHVLGMALLLGGSAVAWIGHRWHDAEPSAAFDAARRYEWLFWGVVAVMVVTGVGNVGAFGEGLPGIGTGWGVTFAVKLAGVVGLLAGSLVRSLLVGRCAELRTRPARREAVRRLRVAYGATTLYVVVLLALAEVLSHG
jgi:putative copper export protein